MEIHTEAGVPPAATQVMTGGTQAGRLRPSQPAGSFRGRLRDLARSRYAQRVAVAAVYFGAAKGGLALAGAHESITAVWPPTGVALAAVLLFGYRIWPAIAAGAFLANITTAGPFLSVLGITAGNTLEALVGGFLLLRVIDFDRSLDRVRDIVALTLVALSASIVSATIGVASLWAGDALATGDLGSSWRVWWLGDATGALIFAPAILVLAQSRAVPRNRGAIAEAVGLAIVLIGISLVVFTSSWAWPYLLFPAVFWIAIRFKQPGAVIGTLLLAVIAVWFTARDHGPFAGGSLDDALLSAQAFVATVALTTLVTAVVVTERQRLRDALVRLSRSELSLAEAEEAGRLGRWEWDVARDQVIWSDELYRIYGLDPSEFEASFQGYLDRIHPDDRGRVAGLIKSALEKRQRFSFEERIVRPGGEVRRLQSRGHVIRDEEGNPVRLTGVCRGVTEV
jgi:PAS domain S-box-containing protein